MKKISKFLVILFIFPLFFLGGCFFEGENVEGGSAILPLPNISGYKVLKYKENYQTDDTLKKYAEFLMTELYANFGILNDLEHISLIENKPDNNENSNFDKIRVQIGESNSIIPTSWHWTFGTKTSGCESQEELTDTLSYYNRAKQENYYNTFVPIYSVAMEIAIMEILIDKTPNSFTVDIDENKTQTRVFYDNAKTQEITTSDCEIYNTVKAEFNKKSRYVGLTKNDVQDLQNYILTEVIGENIIKTGYNSVIINGTSKKYIDVISQIMEKEPQFEKSIFNPYPTSFFQDFDSTAFYTSGKGESLGHIEPAEYQSILVKTNKSIKIFAVSFMLQSDYDITINVKINFYDSNGVYKEVGHKEVKLTNDGFQSITIDFKPITTGVWNDSSFYSASGEAVTNASGVSKYYTVNENGVGVLDSSQVNQKYFEMVFEVQKDNSKSYWPFKTGMELIWY